MEAPELGLLGGTAPYRRSNELQLYSSEFVPTELRRPWIDGAYRACPLPWRACVRTALRPNNETLNVWTHVLALAVFARRSSTGPGFIGSRTDRAVEAVLLCAAQACFCTSAAFHCFNTSSIRAYRRLHKADIAGIVGLIGACFLAGLQLAFGCAPGWGLCYQAAIGSGCVLLAMCAALAESVPRWTVACLIALVGLSVVPVAHWILLLASAEELAHFLPQLARFFSLLGVGVAFYGSALPERWSPGRFNVWGQSHTWWHVCVALAIGSFHSTLVEYSAWRQLHKACRPS